MLKLYRFEYSNYARKVQIVLDLLQLQYRVIDVPYLDRSELVALTGGYIQVPVLVLESGEVLVDSRKICERLLAEPQTVDLCPPPLQGPIWAYADWVDNILEDVLFRIATPNIAAQFFTVPAERALFKFTKERKFGVGCVEQWAQDRDKLVARARDLLKPTLQTLSVCPFIFGDRVTFADAALYGQFAMLRLADAALPGMIDRCLPEWMARVEMAKT